MRTVDDNETARDSLKLSGLFSCAEADKVGYARFV
jgi:hypothetical protein